jgi:hypothetical protein
MCMSNTRLGGGRSDDGTLPGAAASGASEMTATGPVAPAFLTRRSMLNVAAATAAGERAPSILGGTGTGGGGRAPRPGGYPVQPQ